MSKGVKNLIESGKNPVKQRMDRLERLWREGLDAVIGDIVKLFGNERVIAEGMDLIDLRLAALTNLACRKLGITDEELRAEELRLVAGKEAALQAHREKMDALMEQKRTEAELLRANSGEGEEGPHFTFGGGE